MREQAQAEAQHKEKRLDLSAAQVAGSALAAVAAAFLASTMGVYGTIIGAGVMSLVATAGGSLFQHVFRRTGEQIREVTVQTKARPWSRKPGTHGDGEAGSRTLPQPEPGEYTEGTVHGTRLRGWKRTGLAAGTVFAVAMLVITSIELASGSSMAAWFGNDTQGGTSISRGVTGGGSSNSGDHDTDHGPKTGPSGDPSDSSDPDESGDSTGKSGGQGGSSTDGGQGADQGSGDGGQDGGSGGDSGSDSGSDSGAGGDPTAPETTPSGEPSTPADPSPSTSDPGRTGDTPDGTGATRQAPPTTGAPTP
ncbi:hypothetical protein ACH429_00470 [Streptomyces pathocidini]|uniref:Uncharacterized protein n=2 Tax=Streptomyces pathocidini TaxID=1650571 RepID=A0ABW7UIW3_9ACTN